MTAVAMGLADAVGEAVANTSDSLHELVVAMFGKYFSESQNVYVNGSLFNKVVSTPDIIQQLFSAEDAGGMGHKEF